jgi:S-adenosylmethionine uptake transporter
MPDPARPVALAFAVAALGIVAFSTMDALMRGATQAIGAYNAVLWRMLVAVPIGGLVYWLSRSPRPTREGMRLHIIRGVVGTGMAITFFWGLARMAMAEAIALSFIAPVLVLYLAALLLGETIGRGAIIAALLGFGGVLLITFAKLGTEGPARDPLAVLAILLSAALYAYNIVLMRQQAQVASALEIPRFQSLVVVACLALFAPWHAVLPPADQWPALVGSAMLGSLALMLLAWAYRRAEAQILATAEYTALIWAMMFDLLLFGEPILASTVAGALLIVGGCLIAARPGRAPLSPSEAPL